MAREIHYEVFVIKGGQKSWVLHEAHDDRAKAMNSAKYALLQEAFSGARVVKETHNLDTGEYMPVTIFEEGGFESKKRDKEDVKLPCIRPQDLYSPHARVLIARVLEDALARWGVTAMELLHRADLVEDLQASGTVLQHAMQKWAITQSTGANVPVTEVMKQLGDLVERAMERLFKDARAKLFPRIKGENIAGVWQEAFGAAEPSYVLGGAIANSLKKLDGSSEKLQLLLKFMEHLPKEAEGEAVCLAVIDDFVSEIVSGKAGLADLMGEQDDLGASLVLLVELFLGKSDNDAIAARPGLKLLASWFAKNKLEQSRGAVLRCVMDELTGVKRLAPDDIEREVELTRSLAKRMVMCQGPFATIDEIVDAFEKRSTRLTMPEMAEEYMARGMTPDERIELLLDLEDNIIGGTNKARLVDYIVPILTGPKMDPIFVNGDEPLLRRLGRLASLQTRVLQSGFPDKEKEKIVEDFDKLCSRAEERGKLFKSIAARKVSPAEKAVTLLRLLDARVLTEGTCTTMASRHIASLIRDPAFNETLPAVKFPKKDGSQTPVDPSAEFQALMKKTRVSERLKQASAEA